MKRFLKLTFFLVLLIYGCDNGKDYDYNKIEIFNKEENVIISIIEDSLIISSFEKELKLLKKKDYLKNPSNYKYFIKCYSRNSVDIYFINKSYIGKKDGVYPSKVNFLKLLDIE